MPNTLLNSFLFSTTAEPKAVKKGNPYYTRRFYNESRGIISRFHADRNEQLQKKLRNLINTKKEAGEKKVVMTRSYRAGTIENGYDSRSNANI